MAKFLVQIPDEEFSDSEDSLEQMDEIMDALEEWGFGQMKISEV